MLPHLIDRPLTMKRYPDGVEKVFYEKHVPSHAPDWVRTVGVPTSDGDGEVQYVVVSDLPTLVWGSKFGHHKFHVPLWQVGHRRKLPGSPDQIVFDLDPGEGTTMVECCRVAMSSTNSSTRRSCMLGNSSGSKGLQVYAAAVRAIDLGQVPYHGAGDRRAPGARSS